VYSLDRTAGLVITDAADPDAMRLLGRYENGQLDAREMYVVVDAAVIAMYEDIDRSGDDHTVERTVVRMLDAAETSSGSVQRLPLAR